MRRVSAQYTPPRCIRRVPCSINTSTYSLFSRTLTLLHHDRDFTAITAVTGQYLRWYGTD
jgi:hypothetical protein